jgi:hypothetical protein
MMCNNACANTIGGDIPKSDKTIKFLRGGEFFIIKINYDHVLEDEIEDEKECIDYFSAGAVGKVGVVLIDRFLFYTTLGAVGAKGESKEGSFEWGLGLLGGGGIKVALLKFPKTKLMVDLRLLAEICSRKELCARRYIYYWDLESLIRLESHVASYIIQKTRWGTFYMGVRGIRGWCDLDVEKSITGYRRAQGMDRGYFVGWQFSPEGSLEVSFLDQFSISLAFWH